MGKDDRRTALRKRLAADPVFFVRKCLGRDPWEAQERILHSVLEYPRTAVRSCHGVGKSYTAALTILWFLFSRRSIVLSTAPTWRQVEKLIWKEVRSAYRKSLVPLGGNLMPKSPEIQIQQDEWYAAGLSTNEPERFQGFHEEHILVVVDEAAGVTEEIFEAIEGVLTSQGARLLLLGNPTAIGGTFYKAFREPGWSTIRISAFDTPNFTAFDITEEDLASGEWEAKIGTLDLPNPKLITPSWAADKYRRWGPESPPYQARVLGDFPEQGEDTLIPLAWIEAAMERWKDMPEGRPVEIGVDVARFGSDKTVIAVRAGWKVLPLEAHSGKDTMETTGLVVRAKSRHGAGAMHVDEIGIGSAVVDRLAELGHKGTGVNVAEAATDPERFANLRSELWWTMRDRLDPNSKLNPNPVGLPEDDELLADLACMTYRFDSKGRIQVESKEDIKKRLGRSPDRGDAVVLATCVQNRKTPRIISGGQRTAPGIS